jgi:HAD superfamily hydrolase (TIGR01509 family)
MKKIILFDLGGVLINLDYQATISAFEKLGITNFDELYTQADQESLFDDLETGKVSSMHFINRLLDKLPAGITANQVVHSWNAMILNFPLERLKLVERLSKNHTLYLLSNTNGIHMEKVRRELQKVSRKPLEDYFSEVYLSHEIGCRKPHSETFKAVLDKMEVTADKVLFIDDSAQHIEGASAIGIESHHLRGEILDYFDIS